MPLRAKAYIGLLATAASAAVVALFAGHSGGPVGEMPALILLGIVAAWVPLRVHRGSDIHAITLEDAVLVAFLVSPQRSYAPAILAGVTLLARILMRHDVTKTIFATAQVGMAAALAVLAVSPWAVPAAPLSGQGLAVGFLGGAVYNAVTFVGLGLLFHLMSGMSLWTMARDSWRLSLVTWFGNSCLGLLLALVARADVRGLLLLSIIGLGVHLGYRGYSRALLERRRAESLAALNQSLVSFGAGQTDERAWLPCLRELFAAGAAGLLADGSTLELDGTLGAPLPDLTAITEPADLTTAGGGRVLATPIRDGRTISGVLFIMGGEGIEPWGPADLSLLIAVASEVSVALRNKVLFQQVERERARWQEESSKLNDILTAASDGIATFTAAGEINSWNPGMAALTGVDAVQAIGRDWWTVLRVRDVEGNELLPEADHVVTSALSGDRHDDPVAVQVLRRDGQWRWVRATFSPLVSDEGHVDGTVMVARDVTAEHEVEELKADFVATVSHELRTPLTPIKGFLSTLRHRSDMLTPEQVNALHQSMESQVHRLERLVNDLLVVADLDRGRIRLGHELVGLREAVEIAVVEEQQDGATRVRIVGGEDVAAAADASAVIRVLRSLISNALKHSDGPVTVELDRDGPDAVVRVRDEGPGIPPWEQEKIFQRFHRLGDHLHRTQGPGLGLSIAKALVDHLGGSLEVDSDVGRGATFTLRLRSAGPVPLGAPGQRASDAG